MTKSFQLCLLVIGLLSFAIGCGQEKSPPHAHGGPTSPTSSPDLANKDKDKDAEGTDPSITTAPSPAPMTTEQLAAQRKALDQTVWASEQLAQEHEKTIVALWDKLLHEQRKPDGGDPFAVLAAFSFESLMLGSPQSAVEYGHAIRQQLLGDKPTVLSPVDFKVMLEAFRSGGYRILMSEWHHATFDSLPSGAARSTWNMAIYGEHEATQLRFIVSGPLVIEWSGNRDAAGLPIPRAIDATKLSVWSRQGKPGFREVLTIDPSQGGQPRGVQPVLLYDFDGDGLSEIALGNCNKLLRNEGAMKFREEEFLRVPGTAFETGLVADFTGDGVADYVAPSHNGHLLLYVGEAGGSFTARPKGFSSEQGPLVQPQALTAGDVDGDGDLDLFIGQYRISYVGGQMPAPYYDANDGNPAYLLLNDGKGKFTDVTESAGLAAKRFRRSYTAVFADLDGDNDLDLLVVSDFAGIDVYANDGKGKFTDVTDKLIKGDAKLFGMSACFGDFNRDGNLDFYIAGMSSTTARRLDHMKLSRDDAPDVAQMRSRMGYGNRMYLSSDEGFVEPSFKDQVARTGWTWGTTTLDFDNDGNPDIFIANGHASGQSTKDHCSHFWCHDIYVNDSKPNRARDGLFKDVLGGYINRSESWDGYQKNMLLMNRGGKGFVNVGFLLGVGHEYDGRAALSDDLDGDGRMDLVVVEDNWTHGQKLHVYRNELETGHHWIGIRFKEERGKPSPIGAQVTVIASDGRHVGRIVTGETVFGQHAYKLHFGLGEATEVESIEVRWLNGATVRMEKPKVDQWHAVGAPRP